MISLFIFEDDIDLREGLAQYLDNAGFLVKGMFDNCNDIRRTLKQNDVDILLMDIDMPGINGIEGIKLAKEARPAVNILMFTVFDDDKKIFDAICAGADGYLLKKTTPDKIIEALKDVHTGGAPMTPSIAKKVLNFFPKTMVQTDTPLTDKEREVLQQLVNGKSYKQAAVILNITVETVRSHIKKIYSKLHVSSMSQAVVKAIKNKIL